MKRICIILSLLLLLCGCAPQNQPEADPFFATPVKLENKWDYYQNGYLPGYEKPSHMIEILTTPFPIPSEVQGGNLLVTPWIITCGQLSDSTSCPDHYGLTFYNIEPYYIQVAVELSYGTVYCAIPALVTPVYADCMLLYAYSNNELSREGCRISLANQIYTPADIQEHIIFADDEITVYDILPLVSEVSFEEQMKEYRDNGAYAETIDGERYDYVINSDEYILEVRQYLLENVPKMIRKNNNPNVMD